jgi:hypothetical protein
MAKKENRLAHMLSGTDEQSTLIPMEDTNTKTGKIDRRKKEPGNPTKSVSVALKASELAALDAIALSLNGGDPNGNVTRSGLMTWACREFLRRWERGEVKAGDVVKRSVSLTDPK